MEAIISSWQVLVVAGRAASESGTRGRAWQEGRGYVELRMESWLGVDSRAPVWSVQS